MKTEEALQRLATEIRKAIAFYDVGRTVQESNNAIATDDAEVEEAFDNLCNAIREENK